MISVKGRISFHFLLPAILKERRKLKEFIKHIVKKEKRTLASLDYVFCGDQYLLEINERYLQHDDYTDIITFDLSEGREDLTGEIYISVDRVKENASTFQTSFNEELHRVMFHGVLHLCGYGDKSASDRKIMKAKENKYLGEYFQESDRTRK
jgi:probable rRNA maturation factor